MSILKAAMALMDDTVPVENKSRPSRRHRHHHHLRRHLQALLRPEQTHVVVRVQIRRGFFDGMMKKCDEDTRTGADPWQMLYREGSRSC